MLEISTTQYNKTRKVLIDGIEMEFRAPGAGSELAFSQKQRRLTHLQKKLDAGTITDEELDKMDALEGAVMSFFSNIIVGTGENEKKVTQWLQDTPMGVIQYTFEEIQRQVETTDKSAKKEVIEDGTAA